MLLSEDSDMSFISLPYMNSVPSGASRILRIRFTSVDLPLPVLPTIASVFPWSTERFMSFSTGSLLPGVPERQVLNSMALVFPALPAVRDHQRNGSSLSAISGFSSIRALMRSRETGRA